MSLKSIPVIDCVSFAVLRYWGYQLKAGQPAKSGNSADRRKLFIAGLLPNSKTSEPELLSRFKLVARYLTYFLGMLPLWEFRSLLIARRNFFYFNGGK